MIRRVEPADVPAVVGLVRALAAYEHSEDQVELTDELLGEALFGAEPKLFGHVALAGGEVVGFALWFVNFSTWTGRHGLYLEDLFVLPDHRGSGLGRALLTELARTAVERGYGRFEWAVLDWNSPAIGFYRALGARPQDDWTVMRLAGDALTDLASPHRAGAAHG